MKWAVEEICNDTGRVLSEKVYDDYNKALGHFNDIKNKEGVTVCLSKVLSYKKLK
jgi:hypothetical protein